MYALISKPLDRPQPASMLHLILARHNKIEFKKKIRSMQLKYKYSNKLINKHVPYSREDSKTNRIEAPMQGLYNSAHEQKLEINKSMDICK